MLAHNTPTAAMTEEEIDDLVQAVDDAGRLYSWVVQCGDEYDPKAGDVKNSTTLHIIAKNPQEAERIAIGLCYDSPVHHVFEGVDLELVKLRHGS